MITNPITLNTVHNDVDCSKESRENRKDNKAKSIEGELLAETNDGGESIKELVDCSKNERHEAKDGCYLVDAGILCVAIYPHVGNRCGHEDDEDEVEHVKRSLCAGPEHFFLVITIVVMVSL